MATQEQLTVVNNRWAQLNNLSRDAVDRALNFLLLTNAGGAIATLSFLGSVPPIRCQCHRKWRFLFSSWKSFWSAFTWPYGFITSKTSIFAGVAMPPNLSKEHEIGTLLPPTTTGDHLAEQTDSTSLVGVRSAALFWVLGVCLTIKKEHPIAAR